MNRREFLGSLAGDVLLGCMPGLIFAENKDSARPTVRVKMRDGYHLATDVWKPDGPGPFPVVLVRTPYPRESAPPRSYIRDGYVWVQQSCRGKFGSEGQFDPVVGETTDGQDTLDWIANQKWCNGRIGMIGLSYLGMVQVPAASGGHEALRCISPGVAPANYFRDWIRYDGCFALANAVHWPLEWASGPGFRPRSNHFTWNELYKQESLDALFACAGFESRVLRAWVEHDRYDDYWQRIDQHRMYEHITVPGLHMGGWLDHITRGQFDAYAGIRDRGATELARKHQRLIIGPWGHSLSGQTCGVWDFGEAAKYNTKDTHNRTRFEFVNDYQRRFVDLWLKDIDDGIADEPAVKVFLMGENRWVSFNDWPPPEAQVQSWYLNSGGRANTIAGDGVLDRQVPGKSEPDGYTYEPKNPVPTLGGPVYRLIDSGFGPIDQRPIMSRQDVLYYRSKPLENALAVVGEINLKLWISSDAPDTDFIAKLCVVEPGVPGRVVCLTIGSLRCRFRESWSKPKPLNPGQPTRIRIQMGNTAYVFPKASRIALLVTSSSFPRILPNPNTMAPTWKESSPQVARQRVFHELNCPSHIELPIVRF